MTNSYKDLLAQREALEKAIEQARQNEIAGAVTKVRELVAEYGLTVQDVFPGRAGKSAAKSSGGKWLQNTVIPPVARPGLVVARPPSGLMARTAMLS